MTIIIADNFDLFHMNISGAIAAIIISALIASIARRPPLRQNLERAPLADAKLGSNLCGA